MEESAPQCTDAGGDDFTGVATDRHFTRCSNSSPRPLRRALKPASQWHGMVPARDGQRELPLTVLTACSNDVRVMQQDLFGSVLRLIAVESLDAAIAYVNDRPHPLALYLFSDSGAQQQHVLQSTLASGVSVNETLMHIAQDGLAFGGVGLSGMGPLLLQVRLRHHAQTQARVPLIAHQRAGIVFAALRRVFLAGDWIHFENATREILSGF